MNGLSEKMVAELRREIGPPTDRDNKWQPMISAGEVRALLDEVDALAARLASVEALHVPDPGYGDVCAGCRDECLYCEGDHVWPCPTIRVLGSDAHTEQKDAPKITDVPSPRASCRTPRPELYGDAHTEQKETGE